MHFLAACSDPGLIVCLFGSYRQLRAVTGSYRQLQAVTLNSLFGPRDLWRGIAIDFHLPALDLCIFSLCIFSARHALFCLFYSTHLEITWTMFLRNLTETNQWLIDTALQIPPAPHHLTSPSPNTMFLRDPLRNLPNHAPHAAPRVSHNGRHAPGLALGCIASVS